MILFALLGMPCLTLFLLFADGQTGRLGRGAMADEKPAIAFLKGFFYAVTCLIVMLLVRRYVPSSCRSFPLYLLFLFTDHLIPVVFLLTLYFLAYTQKPYNSLLAFGGGFYTLIGIVEIFTRYGQFEPYHLFLLPLVRMGGLLFLTIFFLRFIEWYGLVRVLFVILLVAVPLLSGAISFLYMKAYLLWAAALSALFFLGSLFYSYVERKV
jgi:hypothetical protein